jgi:predicted Rossmann fold nucleotide-binding protein DprA/Smf involved in DNA uptake
MIKSEISRENSKYPPALKVHLADQAPDVVTSLGNASLLNNKKIAIFSSIKCPGEIIIQAYDFVKSLQPSDLAVIGGFHTPLEQELLAILLRKSYPTIICPARSLEKIRIKSEHKEPLENGRLFFLSPFSNTHRPTTETSICRNQFVAAIADRIIIAYAEPGGKTEQLCRQALEWDKSVYTFESKYNASLLSLGAKLIDRLS